MLGKSEKFFLKIEHDFMDIWQYSILSISFFNTFWNVCTAQHIVLKRLKSHGNIPSAIINRIRKLNALE